MGGLGRPADSGGAAEPGALGRHRPRHPADPQCPRLVHRPAAAAARWVGAGGGRLRGAAAAGVDGGPAGDADPDRADECL